MALVSPTTILPLFVGQLTDNPLAIGLIPATMTFGMVVPGVLTSRWVERMPQVKQSVIWIALLERLMLLALALFCLRLGPHHRGALLAAFFGCWLVMSTAMGANMPGYYQLIAKTIPPERRGRLYGFGGAVSGVLGVGGAALAGWLLKTWGFPAGYAACFFAAFIIQTLTVAPLGFMREPVQAPDAARAHPGERSALGAARRDPRLLWLCLALAVFSLNQMAAAFYTDYAIRRFHASTGTVAGFTAVLMGARMAAYLLVGWLGDRWGNRLAMQLATASGIVAAGLAGLAPDLGWLYACFALNEVAVQGWGVCSMNYVMELCPPRRAGAYTAVFNMLSGPFRVLLPLLGGVLITGVGFAPMFWTAVVGGVLTLALLRRVPEPRHDSAPGSGVEALAEE